MTKLCASLLTLACALAAAGCGDPRAAELRSPATESPSTAVELPPTVPGEPVPGLDAAARGRFLLGRALFERLATADEGLGPLYNAERCSECHDEPVTGGGSARVPVLKATRFADGRCDLLESRGGDNIQRRATDLLTAHGMGPERVPDDATATARMIAPPLLGLGLVEAVPEAVLAERADPDDRDGDGISGRLPRLPDGRAARFGRKGDAATVEAFVDTALRFELGFTTPAHPVEETRNGAPVPPEADPMPDPEIDQETLGLLTDYVRFLAPPARDTAAADSEGEAVVQGAALFRQIGCESCHRELLPTQTATASSATPGVQPSPATPAVHPALAGRIVRPYSDFLLHDLGPALANVCGRDAAPSELRTAPLWGLRHRSRFLHDGRATDLASAVATHGGEATAARDAFAALPVDARSAIVRFLESL